MTERLAMGPVPKQTRDKKTVVARELGARAIPAPFIYPPLTDALDRSATRVRDALLSLSIAEIRPTVSQTQLVDTVNELHAAVDASVQAHQLYVTELENSAGVQEQYRDRIAKLLASRVGTSAERYQSVTSILMDEVRRARAHHPPPLHAATLAIPVSQATAMAAVPVDKPTPSMHVTLDNSHGHGHRQGQSPDKETHTHGSGHGRRNENGTGHENIKKRFKTRSKIRIQVSEDQKAV